MNILNNTIMNILLQIQNQRPRLAYAMPQDSEIEFMSYGCRNACSGSCDGSCTGSCDRSCSGGCDGTFGYD